MTIPAAGAPGLPRLYTTVETALFSTAEWLLLATGAAAVLLGAVFVVRRRIEASRPLEERAYRCMAGSGGLRRSVRRVVREASRAASLPAAAILLSESAFDRAAEAWLAVGPSPQRRRHIERTRQTLFGARMAAAANPTETPR